MKQNFYDRPIMIKFTDTYDGEVDTHVGIAYHDEIICACCGGIFEVDDECIEVIECLDWFDFSDFLP